MTPKKIGRPFKYPWLTVEIGESFFVPGRTSNSLQNDAVDHRPRRYRCKKIMTKGVIGIKVTRVS
tara:strand:+ start:8440 stop:8634 length:195 start_codon:yes stop_codon:yes gene_type:complete